MEVGVKADLAYNSTHAFMVYYTICFSGVQYFCMCVCEGDKERATGGKKRHIQNGSLLQYIRKHYGSGSAASVMKEQQQQKTRRLAHLHTHTQ